ncbi:MAG TPA: translocation/assembly module TamB domain-containing protein, partial [Bryobacteraceae bacterium]|nr:translocation/assembly module TamB domain-containing protein [Bryobacteraceae bacterium]
SPVRGFVDIAYLLVDTPEANLIVFPDGHTNIPAPKIKHPSDKSGLETIVDLAIGHFDLRNGTVTFAERKSDLNISGENLRAQLGYNAVHPSYTGEIDIAPLHARLGNNPAEDANIKLPLYLEKDKITLTAAELSTSESHIVISGEMDHLAAPHASAHVNAQVALDEVRRVAGLSAKLDTRRGPRVMNADVTASLDPQHIRIQSARVSLGQSNLEASGTLKDPNGQGAVEFRSTLALNELGRLLEVSAQPEGTVQVGGSASLASNEYRVTANVAGRGLGFREGETRLSGIELASSVTADPRRIALGGLRLTALGGSFGGSAEIENLREFRLEGKLSHFAIEPMARTLLHRGVGYAGAISGPLAASGDFKRPAALAARANLTIEPGGGASGDVPVAGRLNVNYSGAAGTVALDRSYLTLPHTRLDLAGTLGRQVDVRLVSRDLADDLRPVAAVPIKFTGNGAASVNATVTGSLGAPSIAGQIGLTNFAVEGRPFTSLSAHVAATPAGASLANASLTRGPLQMQFSASVGLRDWKPEPFEPLKVDATVRNADARDLLVLAGQGSVPLSGGLTAGVHVSGTVGSPQGNAEVTVANGAIGGEHFDQLRMRAAMDDRNINVPTLQLTAGAARIEASAGFQHPVNDLQHGAIAAQVTSTQIRLAQLRTVNGAPQNLDGTVSLHATAAAELGQQFEIRSLNANLSAQQLSMNGQALGNLTATAASAGQSIHYDVNSNFAGSTIRVNGESSMAGDHQTTASAQIANLAVNRMLAAAGHGDLAMNGTIALDARFAGALANSKPAIRTLEGNLSVKGLSAGGKNLGDLTATASTSGNELSFNLNSNVAQADIQGTGRMELAGDYPLNAQLTFSKVTYANLQPLFGGQAQPFDGEVDGQATVAGPVMQTAALRGTLELTKLEAHAVPTLGAKQPRVNFAVHNAGNVDVALDRGTVTVRNFHLTGQYTDLAVTGTASLTGSSALNLRATGNVRLDALEAFNRDIYSSGSVALDAAVTGSMSQPGVSGRLQFNNASFNLLSLPNGISHATGTVAFSGTHATIQNITGQTGGGKVVLSGTADYGGPQTSLRVQANADHVHVEYPQTVTTEVNARLLLAGTTDSSLVSGTVTITDVALHSHTDIGSILTSAATPPSANAPSTGLVGGVRFDVHIQTSPGVQFRTNLTENLQADASLTLRGTPDQPGMIGRVTVTEGTVIFFGNKYSIDEGSITFSNPHKIDPRLNVALETTVDGVDVSLDVSGPMDKLKLSYRSDPPLEFQQIVSLLASGSVPTTDPVLAAHEPVAPQENFEQAGMSTLLGQAIANPVSGRLQRLFGVSKLEINPQIVGTSSTAMATLTLQQQITKGITFTYIQDVTASNPEIIRVEWAINPQWSAVAQRDEYGLFDLDFFYKKRFH